MIEIGIGEVQDLKNAYKLYLFMAKKGDRHVTKWRDNLREKLTRDEINEAQCLAKTKIDKDRNVINPNWFDEVIVISKLLSL